MNKGKPNYAYINFDTPISAARACPEFITIELKGITVKVIPPCQKMNHRFDCSHFKCDKLENKYAKIKLEEAFRERQGYSPVLIQENSDGIDLWIATK